MHISKTECLKAFFNYLNEYNVLYCVVGDTLNLPEVVPSDIDIVINNDSYMDINKIIKDFSESHNCKLVQVLQHETTASYFVLAFSIGESQIDYIHPDVCSDYSREGKRLIPASDLLYGRNIAVDENGIDKNFYVCSSDMEFLYYLIKKVGKYSLDKEQFTHLLKQYIQKPEECAKNLKKYWQVKDVAIIVNAMENNDYNLLKTSVPHLKKQLTINLKVSYEDYFQELKRKVKRVITPAGLVVAFLGPDGAGKTAIGERLERELSPAFRGVKRFHLKPAFLSNASSKGGVAVTNPHEKPARNMISSIAKLIYFLADYILGFMMMVLPKKIKSHLVIFDRYYHDLLIDPKRYRYGAPMWLAKLVSCFIPQPDLFIILDAPAEVIQARKQEVSLEETKRQRDSYLKFATEQRNCIVLDTSIGIDETVKQGCDEILGFMATRQLKRLNS